MKKNLLTLVAIALMAQSADAMYIIGDPTGKWDTGQGIKMEETEEGWTWTGYIGDFRFFGFATELLPGNDWLSFSAYRLSPVIDNTLAEDGIYPLHFGSPEGSLRGMGRVCTLTVTKDSDGAYSVRVENEDEPEGENWGVLGDFNGWNYDWEMTEINPNIWVASISSMQGNFKFRADGNWTYQYGADSSFTIQDDCQFPILENGDPFAIAECNNATLILDLNQKNATAKINAGQASPLAFRGEMTDWSWNASYCLTETVEPGVFTVIIPSIEAGSIFKLGSLDWSDSYSTGIMYMKLGETYNLQRNEWANMAFGESYNGSVILQVDIYNQTIRAVEDPNSVDSISQTDGNDAYYNLHGVKVENPANGIFIHVANGKTEKKLIR